MPSEERRKVPPDKFTLFEDDSCDFALAPVSEQDDYYTPPHFVVMARNVMGSIDLDPASHNQANKIHRIPNILTMEDDGLIHPWSGNVWVNPPFSNWKQWAAKIWCEYTSGRVDSLIALCATRTLTAGHFQPLLSNSNAICIHTGRFSFIGPYAKDSPDDGHCFLYLGDNCGRFREIFSDVGTVFIK